MPTNSSTILRGGQMTYEPPRDPRQPGRSGAASRSMSSILSPRVPVMPMAPLPVQFPVRGQTLSESFYGGVSSLGDDEDKTGQLGGRARRRGASRMLLG